MTPKRIFEALSFFSTHPDRAIIRLLHGRKALWARFPAETPAEGFAPPTAPPQESAPPPPQADAAQIQAPPEEQVSSCPAESQVSLETPPSSESLPQPAPSPEQIRDRVRALYIQAATLYGKHPRHLKEAIALLSEAWDISGNQRVLLLLVELLNKANRSDEATRQYLIISGLTFANDEVRVAAGFHVMRYGTRSDMEKYCDNLQTRYPDDEMAGLMRQALSSFEDSVESILSKISGTRPNMRALCVGFSILNLNDANDFLEHPLRCLRAERNRMDGLAGHQTHVVIMTTSACERRLRDSAAFKGFSNSNAVHILKLPQPLTACLDSAYGPLQEAVQLALRCYVHYAILEACRRIDGDACLLGNSVILSDDFLAQGLKCLRANNSGVALPIFHASHDTVDTVINSFREPDGGLSIPAEVFPNLILNNLSERHFVDGDEFTNTPHYLAWRVDENRALVIATQYTPVFIRARYIKAPLFPRLDPIDSHFWANHVIEDQGDLILINDSTLGILSLDSDNGSFAIDRSVGKFDPEAVAHWLWPNWSNMTRPPYWDWVKARALRSPIMLPGVLAGEAGDMALHSASAAIDAIEQNLAAMREIPR